MKDGAELPVGGTASDGLSGLKSEQSLKRLKQISSLRARGISKAIDLPQLVVSGDQSSGKSSVLEGISNIPFPRADGVCTKFPTEVILEHSDDRDAITASIIPHASRGEKEREKLQAFKEVMKDYSELPVVISSAGALMGLRGYGENKDGPAFCEDVLRIEVVGRTGLHLSIVDLPGLISTASEEQTEQDVETVKRMVDSYIEKPRTIILAIVQASNDIANQAIIRKSKQVDKEGRRTVGVITKPDLINRGTEARIALLAKNQDTTKLQLGFYILKNPTPLEMEQGISAAQRSANELRFFAAPAWREQNLDPNRVGIDKLRDYLQRLLNRHIEGELPKVRDEIKAMIKTTTHELGGLPIERPTTAHLRVYLSDLAMQFYSMSAAALNGDYDARHTSFFAVDGPAIGQTRLRAIVHKANMEFSKQMRDGGTALKEVRQAPAASTSTVNAVHGSESDETSSDESMTSSDPGARTVSPQEMKEWVRQMYNKSRGRELPGNTSPTLLAELFHYQSSRWQYIARDHVDDVQAAIETFVQQAINSIRMEDRVRAELVDSMQSKLQDNRAGAAVELQKLVADEQRQPITYNHYYTDNIQKTRTSTAQKGMKDKLQKFTDGNGNVATSITNVMACFTSSTNANMDEQACSEALADLDAYYRVAMKTFVDNVCKAVIERHLLSDLPSIFSPHEVAGYSDDDLERIAGETPEAVERRKTLQEQLKTLQEGLGDLRK